MHKWFDGLNEPWRFLAFIALIIVCLIPSTQGMGALLTICIFILLLVSRLRYLKSNKNKER